MRFRVRRALVSLGLLPEKAMQWNHDNDVPILILIGIFVFWRMTCFPEKAAES